MLRREKLTISYCTGRGRCGFPLSERDIAAVRRRQLGEEADLLFMHRETGPESGASDRARVTRTWSGGGSGRRAVSTILRALLLLCVLRCAFLISEPRGAPDLCVSGLARGPVPCEQHRGGLLDGP
jgi:hypothetical protein